MKSTNTSGNPGGLSRLAWNRSQGARESLGRTSRASVYVCNRDPLLRHNHENVEIETSPYMRPYGRGREASASRAESSLTRAGIVCGHGAQNDAIVRKAEASVAQWVQLRLFLHGDFSLGEVISSRMGIRTAFG